MKRLSFKQLQSIKGGGCNRWARRAARATDDDDVRAALIGAFNKCIDGSSTF